jgi:peptide/nickel transport system ATP-binding protein
MNGNGGHLDLGADDDVLLQIEDLVVEHRVRGHGTVHAVSGVSFSVRSGETVALVGESGCGKSSIAKAVLVDPRPTDGSVRFAGAELTELGRRQMRRVRRRLQMIFQDPTSSLNPNRRIADIVNEGPAIWGKESSGGNTVRDMLSAVGLDPDVVSDRRPSELSGGQCQRVAIARALMLDPDLIVCDEPVSGLDISIQAQILNLLNDLKDRRQVALLFITHDLAVMREVSDRVAVMYLGKLCEIGPVDSVLEQPAHPYTRMLLEAVPEPDPEVPLQPFGAHSAGELPSALDPPSGCRFRTRCPLATDLCAAAEPEMRVMGPDHQVACHFATKPTE